MLYEETEKKEIERVYAVFADYIRESPYLEWFWSDKLGYLLLKIGAEYPVLSGDGIEHGLNYHYRTMCRRRTL